MIDLPPNAQKGIEDLPNTMHTKYMVETASMCSGKYFVGRTGSMRFDRDGDMNLGHNLYKIILLQQKIRTWIDGLESNQISNSSHKDIKKTPEWPNIFMW